MTHVSECLKDPTKETFIFAFIHTIISNGKLDSCLNHHSGMRIRSSISPVYNHENQLLKACRSPRVCMQGLKNAIFPDEDHTIKILMSNFEHTHTQTG
jgi:hypothetical protein